MSLRGTALAAALAASLLPLAALPASAQAAKAPSTRDLERINWMELREWVPSRSKTVLLPLGTLEAHGVTANGSDILAPVAIARDIAPVLEAFVAPAIPYGFTGSMDAYAGGLTVPEGPYRTYVRAVIVGLAGNGAEDATAGQAGGVAGASLCAADLISERSANPGRRQGRVPRGRRQVDGEGATR